MRLQRTFEVAAPRERVWDFITSPEKVADCMTGCDGAEELEPGKFRALFSVKVGPIKTKFNLIIETIDLREPEFAEYRTTGEEGGRASRLRAHSKLSVKQVADCLTEVSYTSDVSITGRLGKFGQGIMKKKAEEISDEFIQRLSAAFAPGGLPEEPAPRPPKYNWLTRYARSIIAWLQQARS